MEYLTDMVTIVPKGTKPVKVDELLAAEACALLSSPKQAIWSDSGDRRWIQANGAPLGYSAQTTRQSFAKFSPRYPYMSG